MAETALLSSADILDDSFAVPSSPESLRLQSPTAPGITDHEADSEGYENQNDTDSGTEDGYGIRDATLKQAQSTRTSISSFPGSVIHNDPYLDRDNIGTRTPSQPHSIRSHRDERAKSPFSKRYSPGLARINGFRNPSSVLEMQMCESECDDVTPNHRRKNSQLSHYSYRSSNSLRSSPTKRSSRTNTPHRQGNSTSKLKKEFPLVLLHCTLLPPAVTSYGSLVTDDVLEAVLPDNYRKRWRTLQDKITKNSEVKQRGVLVPHPHEDYDLLEERLLESLELQRPKIRQHHYLGSNDNDSGFESASSHTDSTSSDDEDEDEDALGLHQKCPDCGKHVTLLDPEQERKWEVKVYAANGLMRGGAWAAAWSEMEKVDVEVGVWMPEEVRREIESRLAALQQKQDELDLGEAEILDAQAQTLSQRKISNERTRVGGHYDERMKEIYGGFDTSPERRRQEEIDGLDDARATTNTSVHSTSGNTDVRDFAHFPTYQHSPKPEPAEPSLLDLIHRRVQVLFQDQRNIAIVLLSVLVLFFAISSAPNQGVSASAAVSAASSRHSTSTLSPIVEVSTQHSQSILATTPQVQFVTTAVNTEAMSEASTPPTSEEIRTKSASLTQIVDEKENDNVPTPDEAPPFNNVEVARSIAINQEHQRADSTSTDEDLASTVTLSPSSSENISNPEQSAEADELVEKTTASEAPKLVENESEGNVEDVD